jgi:hypothetical protein
MLHIQEHTGRTQVMEAMETKPMGAITALPAIMLPLKAVATQARVIRDKAIRVRPTRGKPIEGRLSDLSPFAGIGLHPLNGMNGSVGRFPVSTLPDRCGVTVRPFLKRTALRRSELDVRHPYREPLRTILER